MQRVFKPFKFFRFAALWTFVLAAFLQCTTSKHAAKSEEILRPLNDIKRAANYALMNKVLRQSENGRTFFSVYHRPGMDPRLSSHNYKERAQAAVTILGDRRPYKVIVLYKIDKLNGTKYIFDRYDIGLAKQYLEKVNTYLASRPEERDLIDDFRPY